MNPAHRLRRHALIRLLLVLMLAAITTLAMRAWLAPLPVQSREYQVFGTLVRIDIRSRHDSVARTALDDIGRLLDHNHQAWHAWEGDSELGRINASLARGEKAQAPDDLA